jgi:hypothetical protein
VRRRHHLPALPLSDDDFDAVEEDFHRALEERLHPRGPEWLYDVVAGMALPPGARVVDVGSGRGTHARALADRFGFVITPVDPARGTGTAEALPLPDASVDLVWCRDVLTRSAAYCVREVARSCT